VEPNLDNQQDHGWDLTDVLVQCHAAIVILSPRYVNTACLIATIVREALRLLSHNSYVYMLMTNMVRRLDERLDDADFYCRTPSAGSSGVEELQL